MHADMLNYKWDVYVMRKPWIGTIHGLRCSKYGSVLCAGNPWIAQRLRDPWIAQPHMCQAFMQKKKGDQSRERKGNRRLSFGWRTVRLRRAISG